MDKPAAATNRRVVLAGVLPSSIPDLEVKHGGFSNGLECFSFSNAIQTLERLEQQVPDVVIAASRLPDMPGRRLLDLVRERHPQARRFLYWEPSTSRETVRGIGCFHGLLPAPLNLEGLRAALDRSESYARWFQSTRSIESALERFEHWPDPPWLYFTICLGKEATSTSAWEFGTVLGGHTRLRDEFLSLVNHPALGLDQPIADCVEAAEVLGLRNAGAMLLLAHLGSLFRQVSPYLFSAEALFRHSLAAGWLAREVAVKEGLPPVTREDAFMGSVLHDMGQWVLGANAPEAFSLVQAQCARWGRLVPEVERDTFGITHAEVGAWLAIQWGLPTEVVKAIAFHHEPAQGRFGLGSEARSSDEGVAELVKLEVIDSEASPQQFCGTALNALDVVHVACALSSQYLGEPGAGPLAALDTEWLLRLGLGGHEEGWRALAQQQFGRVALSTSLAAAA